MHCVHDIFIYLFLTYLCSPSLKYKIHLRKYFVLLTNIVLDSYSSSQISLNVLISFIYENVNVSIISEFLRVSTVSVTL